VDAGVPQAAEGPEGREDTMTREERQEVERWRVVADPQAAWRNAKPLSPADQTELEQWREGQRRWRLMVAVAQLVVVVLIAAVVTLFVLIGGASETCC
jgi:hypothetical protein